eukprot:scaffold3672_cov46-Attheya_sp.AAC.1
MASETGKQKKRQYHCLDIWAISNETLSLTGVHHVRQGSNGSFPTMYICMRGPLIFCIPNGLSDSNLEDVQLNGPWIGAGPPHGVLPFANVLSIPAINSIMGKKFAGAPANDFIPAYPSVEHPLPRRLQKSHRWASYPMGLLESFIKIHTSKLWPSNTDKVYCGMHCGTGRVQAPDGTN